MASLSPAAAPPAAPLPDEELLQYVEGGLKPQEHAALEQRLLADEVARSKVAVLRSCLVEGPARPGREEPPGNPRYFFGFSPAYPSSQTFSHPFTDSLLAQVRLDWAGERLRLSVSLQEAGTPCAAQVRLCRRGALLGERGLCAGPGAGPADFEGLPPGRYQIEVHPDGQGEGSAVVPLRLGLDVHCT